VANQYGFVAKQVLFEKDQCVLVTKQGLFAPEQSRSVTEITVFVRGSVSPRPSSSSISKYEGIVVRSDLLLSRSLSQIALKQGTVGDWFGNTAAAWVM